jgi:hypothetical protein
MWNRVTPDWSVRPMPPLPQSSDSDAKLTGGVGPREEPSVHSEPRGGRGRPATSLLDWSENADRPFHFPHGYRGAVLPAAQVASDDAARTRWLAANNVRTQFFDAGIGCCWFAEMGDEEPVSGDTQDEAIERLARKKGLPLWTE